MISHGRFITDFFFLFLHGWRHEKIAIMLSIWSSDETEIWTENLVFNVGQRGAEWDCVSGCGKYQRLHCHHGRKGRAENKAHHRAGAMWIKRSKNPEKDIRKDLYGVCQTKAGRFLLICLWIWSEYLITARILQTMLKIWYKIITYNRVSFAEEHEGKNINTVDIIFLNSKWVSNIIHVHRKDVCWVAAIAVLQPGAQ